MLIHSSQKSVAGSAESSVIRVGGRVGHTMDESVINFKNVSCGGGSSSSNPYPPITPYTPPSELTNFTPKHPRPTIETVSDHAATTDGIVGEFVCGAYTLSSVVGTAGEGRPASSYGLFATVRRACTVSRRDVIAARRHRRSLVVVIVVPTFSNVSVCFFLTKF